jgi:hypothetical protein
MTSGKSRAEEREGFFALLRMTTCGGRRRGERDSSLSLRMTNGLGVRKRGPSLRSG